MGGPVQRTQLSDRERRRRSRLAQIIHEARFLRGTLSLRNFHAANPVVTALGGSPMPASTWFDGKGESCASCCASGMGKAHPGSG